MAKHRIRRPPRFNARSFLFNFFINDFTYAITESEFCNFADDNTIYACSQNLEHVVSCLKDDTHSALCWFRDNGMVANPSKFQVIFLGLKSDQEYAFEIDKKPIPATSTVKLLGITIDCQLKFSEHMNTLCKKANNKTSTFIASSGIFRSGQQTYSVQ